jgi:hypothetical protein
MLNRGTTGFSLDSYFDLSFPYGYLGRITALATYGMMFSGAPMFMWRWCVACAVFINNITATYYSMEDVWATPFEVVHNEPFPDSSIVVPFGCGVLVLLKEEEQGKFQSRCALMIFVHYAVNHLLYTYAVYSPRTKRIVYRQDCIFLTNVFPMRTARSRNGLGSDGDGIIPYRAPLSIRKGEEASLSFEGWNVDQPLPDYQDHVTGHNLCAPPVSQQESSGTSNRISHYVFPDNPSFGPPSTVKVPRFQIEETPADTGDMEHEEQQQDNESQTGCISDLRDAKQHVDDAPIIGRVRRPDRKNGDTNKSVTRRPVRDRWYYERVEDSGERAYLSKFTIPTEGKENTDIDKPMGDEIRTMLISDHIAMLSPVIPPALGEFGELDIISKTVVDQITTDETGACSLLGLIFHDDELDWCRITGWGIESGTIIVFYSPVSAQDAAIEEFTSIDEMLLSIKVSVHDPLRLNRRKSGIYMFTLFE